MPNKEEKHEIEIFLGWLDYQGFNLDVIEKIRNLLLPPEEEKVDKDDQLTGESILAG